MIDDYDLELAYSCILFASDLNRLISDVSFPVALVLLGLTHTLYVGCAMRTLPVRTDAHSICRVRNAHLTAISSV